MKSHYRGHKMAVWLNLIPQLHQPGEEDVSMRHHHFHEREEHYYAGHVRAESFTRIPPPQPPQLSVSGQSPIEGPTQCVSDSLEAALSPTADPIDEDDDETELLQRLATRHYYSYTAALGVTVGVGCLLLVLNMLIFAGIYHQRERSKRRRGSRRSSSPGSHSANEGIPLSQYNRNPGCASPHCEKSQKVLEPPPCYNTLTKAPKASKESHQEQIKDTSSEHNQTQSTRNMDQHRHSTASEGNKMPHVPPTPPLRTSSNPATSPPGDTPHQGGTIKKRVQIQEISV